MALVKVQTDPDGPRSTHSDDPTLAAVEPRSLDQHPASDFQPRYADPHGSAEVDFHRVALGLGLDQDETILQMPSDDCPLGIGR